MTLYEKLAKDELEADAYMKDITTLAIISENAKAAGKLLAKEDGIIYGLELAKTVFQYQSNLDFEMKVKDGERVEKGKIIGEVSGRARDILSRERVALNYLQRLSGIASLTNEYATAAGIIKILDTRKTTPYLREIEKEAVKAGGGYNHRMNLEEMFLIKDNHLEVCSIKDAITKARNFSKYADIEIEVNTFEQADEASRYGPDRIMLDNMSIEEMKKAIEIIRRRGRIEIEASGNMNLDRVKEIAERGLDLDYISVGALTHSFKSLDISLELEMKR